MKDMGVVQALAVVALMVAATMAATRVNGECQRTCGDLTIPYPFGTTGCRYVHANDDETFLITCNKSFHPPKPFLSRGNLEVTNISLSDGEIRILGPVASDCYDADGRPTKQESTQIFTTGNFTLSPKKNKFMAMGCDTSAILRSWLGVDGGDWFNTGCMSYCSSDTRVQDSCSGVGCCQTDIPGRLWFVQVDLSSYSNYTNVSSSTRKCSHAFVAANEFRFKKEYLQNFRQDRVPVVFDWAVGNHTCVEAKRDMNKYLCKVNSDCVDGLREGVDGYLCRCLKGYEGNPYLDGCKDIDECSGNLNDCEKICHNIDGSYKCACPKGYHLSKDRKACSRNKTALLVILLSSGLGLLALLFGILGSCMVYRESKMTKQRHRYFEQNGGKLLREKLSGSGQELRIFSGEELRKATRSYHESTILGRGGQGTVYKGILPDNTQVAIKKSRIGDPTEDQFVKEIFMLSQIKHDNVVKILGCCLETEVPLLVYEFVKNGSVFDHMHKPAHFTNIIPWETRRKIGTQTAAALSHLHSTTPAPIVHRDVKLANILLDDHYNAKVSDFGASKLMPTNRSELTTLVQGTLGYLDPEYFQTNQLTEKSDVYSFGVVLIELLTGQKVLDFERPKEEMYITVRFISLMKEDRLHEILDRQLLEVADGSVVEQLKKVAKIAGACVKVKGKERPTMQEVAYELEALKELGKGNMSSTVGLESEYLLGDHYSSITLDDGEATGSSMGFDSISKQVTFDIESAR